MKVRLLLLLCLTVMFSMTTQADTTSIDLDTLYQSYITDDVRHQLEQFDRLKIQLEQQEQEREKRQTLWYLILAGCAISAIIVTGGIFREVFKGQESAPLSRKLSAGAICLCGGTAIFLLDVGWFYMSIEANQKVQKLILFTILLVLGIALWIYTKNLKNENTNDV